MHHHGYDEPIKQGSPRKLRVQGFIKPKRNFDYQRDGI